MTLLVIELREGAKRRGTKRTVKRWREGGGSAHKIIYMKINSLVLLPILNVFKVLLSLISGTPTKHHQATFPSPSLPHQVLWASVITLLIWSFSFYLLSQPL